MKQNCKYSELYIKGFKKSPVLFKIEMYACFKREIVDNLKVKIQEEAFFIRFYWVFLKTRFGINLINHDE